MKCYEARQPISGAQSIANRDDATLMSAGDMALGGALDASRRATGSAQRIHNLGATIESLGDLDIHADVLDNANDGFAYQLVPDAGTRVVRLLHSGVEYTEDRIRTNFGSLTRRSDAEGWSVLLPSADFPFDQFPADATSWAKPVPAGDRNAFEIERTYTEYWCGAECGSESVLNYPASHAIWQRMGVTPPPAAPSYSGPDCASEGIYCNAAEQSAYNNYRTALTAYATQKQQAEQRLDARIDAYNASVRARRLHDWTVLDVTETQYTPQVSQTDPGRILVGGNLNAHFGTSALNDKSQIIVGGTASITGATLNNPGVEAMAETRRVGNTVYSQYINKKWSSDSRSFTDTPYTATTTQTVDLAAADYRQNTAPTTSGAAAGARANAATGASATGTAAASAAPVASAGAGTAPSVGSNPALGSASIAGISLPSSALFRTNPNSTTGYLVETDPRFANYRQWLSSDYMLSALAIDPATSQKRLGDGFYEQKLIREQVASLTGQRFLGDYRDDEAQYRALMTAGVTFAQSHQLRPGIALSAAQVAQLTSDIVWLEAREVTLPDGSTTTALVPQVYLVPRTGDLHPSGALFAAKDFNIQLSGDLTNSGTIAGRQVTRITAQNVANLGGRISGSRTGITATQDISNIGGIIEADIALVLNAGRNLEVASTTQSTETRAGPNTFTRTTLDRVAGLYVSDAAGVLIASAGQDVNLTGALLQSGGTVQVQAGRDLTLGTVRTEKSDQAHWNASNHLSSSASSEVGTRIQSQGNTTLIAGQDINARAADVQAQGALDVQAARDVNISAGTRSQAYDEAHQVKSKGLLSSKTTTTRSSASASQALGSSFGGDTVNIQSGQDIRVQGSSVISDNGSTLVAGRDVSITAQETHSASSSFSQTRKSGLMGSGGIGFSIGTQQQSNDQRDSGTSAAASTVGSIAGDVNIVAGRNYRQVGSDVLSPAGDINVAAQDIAIVEARSSQREQTEQKFSQSGLTVAITAPALSAVQGMANTAQAVGHTGNSRTQALGAATLALQGRELAAEAGKVGDALTQGKSPAEAASVGISISIGGSKSQSTSDTRSNNAQASSLQAGGNINLVASGAGAGSNLLIQGSEVKAGDTVSLSADNQVNVLASQDTTEHDKRSKNSSASIGVGISFGAETRVGVTVSASAGKGAGTGQDVSQNNSHIEAGKQILIKSGGDTNLRGAVVAANTVKADVGGDLTIESLQDTSHYRESNKQVGGSVTFGPAPGASVSASASKINSDYASVSEQSGIRAGDGGFQVNVKGKTELTGGAITSTDKAVQENKNSFNSAGGLSTSDVQNTASYDASASGFTVGVGSSLGSSGAGVGSDNGNASSTTQAAISGVAGNAEARTGDSEVGITPIFDKDKVKAEVGAQVAITTAFTQQAVPAAARFADDRAIALRREGKEDEARKWDEGGEYRVAMHAGIGLLAGGIGGAAGAATSAAAVPVIGEQIASLNLPEPVRQGLTQVVGAAVGGAVGGTAGAASAQTQTALNYVSHSPFTNVRRTVSQENARLMNQCGANCTEQDMRRIDQQMVKLETAGNLAAIGKNSKLTTEQAVQLGETLAALLPVYGTPIALYQAVSGNSLTGKELGTAERVLNVAAAALPLGSAAYKLVTTAAQDMAKMSASIGAIQGFKSAEEVNAVMNAFNKAPAWKEGTQIAEATLKPGTKVQMVVDKTAFDRISKGDTTFAGNWATFDDIPNQAFARNDLAITNEFKRDVGYVVELEIVKPVNAQIGVVGSQGAAKGGANQMNFLFEQRNGGEFFRFLDGGRLP